MSRGRIDRLRRDRPSNRHTIWVGSGENNSQRSVSWGDGGLPLARRRQELGERRPQGQPAHRPDRGRPARLRRRLGSRRRARSGTPAATAGSTRPPTAARRGSTCSRSARTRAPTRCTSTRATPTSPMRAPTSAGAGSGRSSTAARSRRSTSRRTPASRGRKLENGLPSVDKGRIGMAISPADPDVLYAIVEAQRGEGGFYRSTDRGRELDQDELEGRAARSTTTSWSAIRTTPTPSTAWTPTPRGRATAARPSSASATATATSTTTRCGSTRAKRDTW